MITIMRIKTVTWNIGGGKLLQPGTNPTLLSSYSNEGIDEIVSWLKRESPDVITLQETQKKDKNDQAEYITKQLGYGYYFHDSTSDSHIDEGHKLGHAIISRYPLASHKTGFFINPKVKVEWEDGSIATSFDKGYTNCAMTIEGSVVLITTLHLIPFRRFDIAIDSDLAASIMRNVCNELDISFERGIIQGDFNIDSKTLRSYMPRLFKSGMNEIPLSSPTTPKGRKYDHVLFKGLKLVKSRVDSSVLTDHFPVVCEFDF